MRILGIDPGYERLGLAVIEKSEGKETFIHSECFQTSKELSFHARLGLVGAAISRVITDHGVKHLALENVYFNTNQKTAMDVAAVRGVALYVGSYHGLETFEYTPPQIKTAVAGNGRGSKKDVIAMVRTLLSIPKEIKLDDEYDAIAVALTHSAIHR